MCHKRARHRCDLRNARNPRRVGLQLGSSFKWTRKSIPRGVFDGCHTRTPRATRVFPYPGNSRTDGVVKSVPARCTFYACPLHEPQPAPAPRRPARRRATARGTGGRHARPAVGGSATAPCGRPTPWRPACPPRTASYSHSDNNRSAPLSAYAQRATGCRL